MFSQKSIAAALTTCLLLSNAPNVYAQSTLNQSTWNQLPYLSNQADKEAPNPELVRAKKLLEKGEHAEALKIMQDLGSKGNAKAKFNEALMRFYGYGAPADKQRARALFDEAAKLGSPFVKFTVGSWYFYGDTGVVTYEAPSMQQHNRPLPADRDRALALFNEAAEAGLSQAQHQLANIYHLGITVEKNVPLAIKWYEAAAKQGDIYAYSELLVLVSRTEQYRDCEKSLYWIHRPVTESDNPYYNMLVQHDAYDYLSKYYTYGVCVEKDAAKARKFRAKANEFEKKMDDALRGEASQ